MDARWADAKVASDPSHSQRLLRVLQDLEDAKGVGDRAQMPARSAIHDAAPHAGTPLAFL